MIIGLPRGGVPVACSVAESLNATLDVIVVRKLVLPGDAGISVGAIAEDSVIVFDHDAIARGAVSQDALSAAIDREMQVLRRRVTRIRDHNSPIPLKGRMTIIVDDGLSTGLTARAACRVARRRGASSVVIATPVVPIGWTAHLTQEADAFEAMHEADDVHAVSEFYEFFPPVDDEEVLRSLI